MRHHNAPGALDRHAERRLAKPKPHAAPCHLGHLGSGCGVRNHEVRAEAADIERRIRRFGGYRRQGGVGQEQQRKGVEVGSRGRLELHEFRWEPANIRQRFVRCSGEDGAQFGVHILMGRPPAPVVIERLRREQRPKADLVLQGARQLGIDVGGTGAEGAPVRKGDFGWT